ncbi:MAG: exo-alpha-sialidase [Planctomycetia bacterium]|nr:exo-alpha-sialidase [Planctomycetia bacterium]
MRRVAIAAILACAAAASAESPFRAVDLPGGGANPCVVSAADGALLAVYGDDGAVWFRRSDDGKTWTEPVKVGEDCEYRGERGPRLGDAGNGTLGCVWQGKGTFGAALSRDDGKTWAATAPRDAGARGGVDVPSIAGDGKGKLVAAWVDGRDEKGGGAEGDAYAATWSGGTWSKNVKVNADIRICPCCAFAMARDASGLVFLACRTARKDVREIGVFVTRDAGKSWSRGQVSSDGWEMNGCPMAGPSIGVSPDGKTVALAWRYQGEARWALSRDGGARFAQGGTLDTGLAMGDYPKVAVTDAGAVVLAWTSGGAQRLAVKAPAGARAAKVEDAAVTSARLLAVSGKAEVIVVRVVK